MYIGEFSTGSTAYFVFTTINSSGAPTALSSAAVTVYRGSSTLPSATGLTLTSTFGAVVGLNHVQVDMGLTSPFYEPAMSYFAVVTSGGVGDESLAGYVLAHWSIKDRIAVISSLSAILTVSSVVTISTAALISTSNVFTSVASVTGNVTGSVGSVASATGLASAIWNATRASYTAAGSFGQSISTGSSIAAAVWDITGVTGNVAGNVTGSVGSVASATGIATAVWGATRASYTGAGSFGQSISTGSSIAALTWNINSVVGAVGSVTGNVTGSIGSLTTAAAVQVNAEVVDALDTDTYAEPAAGIPPATAPLTRKIGQLYAAMRNQLTVSSSAKVFYADDASVLFGKVLSQDSTGSTGVYQEAEATTST